MPPKIRIRKEEIVAAALEIVRERGAAALNAREIAKRLSCSTQPIFSNYAAMEDLRQDVIRAAKELYEKALAQGMQNPNYPPYKASGLAYILFAKENPELFKLLFMRDRSAEKVADERGDVAELVEIIARNLGISGEDAYLFHLEMWIYVHGIATMEATAYLNWDEEMISRVLTDAYQGLALRFQNRTEEEA